MLKEFDGLTQQMFEKPFRDMLFSVYNKAVEEMYTDNINRLGFESDFDSLEFAVLDTVKGVNLKEFKHYIENEIQHDDTIVGVLLIKGKNDTVPVIIKPKNFKLNDMFKD